MTDAADVSGQECSRSLFDTDKNLDVPVAGGDAAEELEKSVDVQKTEEAALPSDAEEEEEPQATQLVPAEEEEEEAPGTETVEEEVHADEVAESMAGEEEPSASQAAVGGKRGAGTKLVQERVAKRPRWAWGDKAFADITMRDVEALVRRCNSLEEKVESHADATSELKALEDLNKELENQMKEVTPAKVERVKASIAKQLSAQMIYTSAWNTQLKKDSRTISAFVPNVSSELAKALGGMECEATNKRTTYWFGAIAPVRTVPEPKSQKEEKPKGDALVLGHWLTLKYVKTTCELQAVTTYRFGDAEKATKPKPTPKPKGKGRGKGGRAKQDEEDQLVQADDDSDYGGEDRLPLEDASMDASVAVGGN